MDTNKRQISHRGKRRVLKSRRRAKSAVRNCGASKWRAAFQKQHLFLYAAPWKNRSLHCRPQGANKMEKKWGARAAKHRPTPFFTEGIFWVFFVWAARFFGYPPKSRRPEKNPCRFGIFARHFSGFLLLGALSIGLYSCSVIP